MDDGSPFLGVDFVIDTGGSFSEIAQLQQVMTSAEVKIVAEAAKIEKATAGMVQLGGATASIQAYGNATSRELQNVRQEKARTEKAGEALVRQLEREAASLGKTRDQMREARVEAIALAAAEQGNLDLADRLAAASRRRAQAADAAAEAEQRAAQAAKVAAESAGLGDRADRLRAAIDPAASAQQRFNREMAEARALISAGAIGLDDYAAKLRIEQAALDAATDAKGRSTKGAGQMRAAMQGASYQVQDLITQISMGTNPINALAVQGGQLAGQFANVEGKAGKVASFMIGPWGLAITAGMMVLAPFIAKLLEGNDALDEAVDKLKKDARETDVTARAKAAFTKTVEGNRAALQENRAALEQLSDASKTAARRALESALARQDDSRALVKNTRDILDNAEAMAEYNRVRASRGGPQGEAVALQLGAESARIAELRKRLAGVQGDLTEADRQVSEALSRRIVELTESRGTALGRLKEKYEGPNGLIELARRAASVDEVRNGTLAKQIGLLRQKQSADEDAIRAAERSQLKVNPLGDGVATFRSREQAIGIAGRELQQMGMRVDGNVQFGYTKGHANDADHNRYKIDVNVGKGVTEANVPDLKKRYDEIARLYQARGYDVRWNGQFYAANGTGPTRSAAGHRDHMDINAPGTIVGKATNASTMRQDLAELGREAKEEAQRAKAIMDEATGYLSRLEGESSVFGKTASEIKSMEVAAAAAKAPTKELRDAILAAGVELDLKKSFPSAEEINNLKLAFDFDGLAKSLDPFAEQMKALQAVSEQMNQIADQAAVMGDAMASAFGRPGEVIGGLIARMADYNAQRADLAATGMSEAEVDKKLALLRTRNTMAAISGVKGLFKEHSAAYKVMGAIEKAHAALQLVNAIRSIAMDSAKTASSVANSGVRAAADGVAAIAKAIASLPFPFNIAAGAATAAALVAFGVKVFGGGGGSAAVKPPSAEDLQAAAGSGTVLGDSKAKSESIARSLEIVASNTNRDLEYSNSMLRSLRSIDTGIARLAGTVAQQVQVSGSMFDTTGQNLGQSGKSGFMGLFGSSTMRSVYDLGLQLNAASIGSILNGGISGSTYQTIEQIKKKNGFFGIGGGTKTSYQMTTGAVDPAITAAITDVVRGLRNGLVSAAEVIGIEGAAAMLDGFQVNIGKLSFKDMTGEEIERQLNAVFSSIGDQLTGQLMPGLSSMQLVGEGLFETFSRVAREYQVVDVALRSIGRTFGAVGVSSIAARDALVQLFGGLDDFAEATGFFRDQFLSDAEQIAPIAASVAAELLRLGLAGMTTRDQFNQAVLGLDLTTEAGRQMYASLLAVAPAFDKVLDYQEQSLKQSNDGLKQTAEQFGKLAESLRKYRDSLFSAGAAQGSAYDTLRAKFLETEALAAKGDQKALGELEGAGKSFLDAALNNAGTREQYQRDVAIVARGVDAGIFAAEATADYAQLQLDALGNAVAVLSSIQTNTAATAAALSGSVTIPAPATLPSGIAPQQQPGDTYVIAAQTNEQANSAGSSASNEFFAAAVADLQAELAAMRSETTAGLASIAGSNNRIARTLDDVTAEGGGMALAMVASQ